MGLTPCLRQRERGILLLPVHR